MHAVQCKAVAPNVFGWLDTCNVYVIKDGASAILIDIGDGLVLDALSQIGVTTVEWVLYTHHHREQCQGHPQLAGHALDSCGVKVAVPANGSESRLSMPYSLRTCTATSFLDAEHVRKTRGAHIWTHQRVVDLIERPLDYDYNAMIPAYRERPTGVVTRPWWPQRQYRRGWLWLRRDIPAWHRPRPHSGRLLVGNRGSNASDIPLH